MSGDQTMRADGALLLLVEKPKLDFRKSCRARATKLWRERLFGLNSRDGVGQHCDVTISVTNLINFFQLSTFNSDLSAWPSQTRVAIFRSSNNSTSHSGTGICIHQSLSQLRRGCSPLHEDSWQCKLWRHNVKSHNTTCRYFNSNVRNFVVVLNRVLPFAKNSLLGR